MVRQMRMMMITTLKKAMMKIRTREAEPRPAVVENGQPEPSLKIAQSVEAKDAVEAKHRRAAPFRPITGSRLGQGLAFRWAQLSIEPASCALS